MLTQEETKYTTWFVHKFCCQKQVLFARSEPFWAPCDYLVPLRAKFYQIFIFTYDFDTDIFLSTLCSQLISGESLVSFIHSTHIHMRAFALIPPKKTWNCNFFLNFIFFNLLFQKSALHWKKSKQKFDITAW